MMLLIRPRVKQRTADKRKYAATLLPRFLYWPWKTFKKALSFSGEALLHYEIYIVLPLLLATAVVTFDAHALMEFFKHISITVAAVLFIKILTIFLTFFLRRKIRDEKARQRENQSRKSTRKEPRKYRS